MLINRVKKRGCLKDTLSLIDPIFDPIFSIFLIISLLFSINLFAGDTQELIKAHHEALKVYKTQDKNVTKSIELLRKAGVQEVLNEKPINMSKGKYVQLLNDYGFFLQQSANFENNVTLVLDGFPFVRDKSVTTDERYLDYKHIQNFTQKTKNLCEAVNYLDRAIELSPKRSSAYLNLGDTYWQLYLYRNKTGIERGNRLGFTEQVGCKLFQTGYKKGPPELSIFSHSYDSLLARKSYLVYQGYVKIMKEKNREKLIPSRVKDFMQRPKRYTVIKDESPATGDAKVCQDLQKAFDGFDCLECKDTYREEVWSKHPWLNKSIFELNPKFSRIYDMSINKYFYHKQELIDNNGTGDFGYRYNNNIYIFGGGDSFDYWSKRMKEEQGDPPPWESKCELIYINLKEKNKWENKL